ncbi:MAG: prepilin-type N-terminal cleavage/methylation domain-containing protein [Tissierellia bacterium]|nr:prepilin-type N-terminal cleavage/methylation domain-containing protein [Tissierellia bacterium]
MKKRGFTLIEMIVVISIISVIASIALIKGDFLNKKQEKNEIQIVLEELNHAKEKAMATGKDSVVTLKSNTITIRLNDGNLDYKDSIKLEYIRFSNTKKEIVFKKNGSVVGSNTYSIYGKNREYSLVISVVTGSCRIE